MDPGGSGRSCPEQPVGGIGPVPSPGERGAVRLGADGRHVAVLVRMRAGRVPDVVAFDDERPAVLEDPAVGRDRASSTSLGARAGSATSWSH